MCEQVTGEKCQCRTRTCTQPIPQFGGRLCQGSNVEIARCESRINNTMNFLKIVFNLLYSFYSSWRLVFME